MAGSKGGLVGLSAPFLKSLALVPLTLLPIIDPVGNVPVFSAFAGTDPNVMATLNQGRP